MLRSFFGRSIATSYPPEVGGLLRWCIVNPGGTNVYIKKYKSLVLPSLSHLKDVLIPKITNIYVKRFASTTKQHIEKPANPLLSYSKYSEAQTLVSNSIVRKKLFNNIQNAKVINDKEIDHIEGYFLNLIDAVSGFHSPETVDTIASLWEIIIAKDSSIKCWFVLQGKIFIQKDKFIHILINSGNYELYEKLVKPIYYNKSLPKVKPTWADQLASTFQIRVDSFGNSTFNRDLILRYLNDHKIPTDKRRKLLSIFAEKGILYNQDANQKYNYINAFVGFTKILQDDHFHFSKPDYRVYLGVIRLMTMVEGVRFSENISRIRQIILFNELQPQSLFNFITSAMYAIIPYSPRAVIELWEYKIDLLETSESSQQEVLNSEDLKFAMSAYCNLNFLTTSLELYEKFPDLQHEDQIEIILKLSEKSKDWKALQKQFEDMYGKGKLPYVVHYAVVMNALASTGAVREVDMLYDQLKKRKLKPNSAIFASLINSRLFNNDISGAKECFELYLKESKSSEFTNRPNSYLYGLIFDVLLKSGDFKTSFTFLKSAIEEQKKLNLYLIDAKILGKFVNYMATNYELSKIEYLRNIAMELNLDDEDFYIQLLRAYTRLQEYEKAEDAIYVAHLKSLVPFKSSEIYKAQLRNYRYWFQANRTPEGRKKITERMEFIIDMINDGDISYRKNKGLYNEAIKYYLVKRDIEKAERIFDLVDQNGLLEEFHFFPLFKYYIRQGTYESNSHVLELYRKMTKQKLTITSKTYVHLMKALVYLDTHNNNGFRNSYQLLQSVLELNGLSLGDTERKAKKVSKFIHEDAIDLCKIVSVYVLATINHDNGSIKLLVDFLNQIKSILGNQLSSEFRFTIFQEMSKLYIKQGSISLASKLVDNGLQDVSRRVNKLIAERELLNYPFMIPKPLQLEYRQLMELKLKCMRSTNSPPKEYTQVFKEAFDMSIKLSGDQYGRIIGEMLKLRHPDTIKYILGICEDHLVAGNWVEALLMRRMQFLYKLVILYQCKFVGTVTTFERYAVLNNFYNVHNIGAIEKEFSYMRDPTSYLIKLIEDFNELYSRHRRWTLDSILENMAVFFNPEQQIPSNNKILSSLLNGIWRAVESYCDGDKTKAFKLMDEYPETIEFLLYNGVSRIRLMVFRKVIDKTISVPRSTQKEDFEGRKARTEEALNVLINKSFGL